MRGMVSIDGSVQQRLWRERIHRHASSCRWQTCLARQYSGLVYFWFHSPLYYWITSITGREKGTEKAWPRSICVVLVVFNELSAKHWYKQSRRKKWLIKIRRISVDYDALPLCPAWKIVFHSSICSALWIDITVGSSRRSRSTRRHVTCSHLDGYAFSQEERGVVPQDQLIRNSAANVAETLVIPPPGPRIWHLFGWPSKFSPVIIFFLSSISFCDGFLIDACYRLSSSQSYSFVCRLFHRGVSWFVVGCFRIRYNFIWPVADYRSGMTTMLVRTDRSSCQVKKAKKQRRERERRK